MAAKAQELGATDTSKANEAATVVGEKMGSLAGVTREKAPREGTIATTATTVANGLELASSYLQEKNSNIWQKTSPVRSQIPHPISVSWLWLFAHPTPEIIWRTRCQ